MQNFFNDEPINPVETEHKTLLIAHGDGSFSHLKKPSFMLYEQRCISINNEEPVPFEDIGDSLLTAKEFASDDEAWEYYFNHLKN